MQGFPQQGQQLSTRKAVLIFLKNVGPPLVFYVDEPETLFAEIKQIIAKAVQTSPKMLEQVGKGPLKKVAVLDTQIAAVALQEEPQMG